MPLVFSSAILVTLAFYYRRNKTITQDTNRSENSNQISVKEANYRIRLSTKMTVMKYKPGLVLLKNALEMETQLQVAKGCFESGHIQRRWWCESISRHVLPTTTPRDEVNSKGSSRPTEWNLTGERQGRGRCYDTVESFVGGEDLSAFARLCGDVAHENDPEMPLMEATHLLLLLYSKSRKLGWHRDDGPIDGTSPLPIVSLSLGNSCDFLVKEKESEKPISIRIDSGDVILFGGPSRHCMHTVSKIFDNTTPHELAELEAEMRQKCPSKSYAYSKATQGFRVNLTFRHAPELLGKEKEERFYHFASATRRFLDTQREKGTLEARREAKERHDKRNAKKR